VDVEQRGGGGVDLSLANEVKSSASLAGPGKKL
jgi:hypothetical protein